MEGFLLNEQTWLQHLKEKRLAYGLSQNRLAVATGITRQYLSDIETGKVKPSEDLQQSLWEALERFNPDAPLEMLFDYVRIRFPTTDVQQVVENILQLKLSYFLHEDYGFYSYSEHYALGDIFVLCSHELDKGVLVELKGRGCRQFESYLLAQQRSWYEFFMDVLVAGGVMKRLDLAINDKTGMEEGQVTIDGYTQKVPSPFTVIATQNPFGSAGTQLLPESQLDRFTICLHMGYPTQEEEVEILKRKQTPASYEVQPVISACDMLEMQKECEQVYIHEHLLIYIVELLNATRNHASIYQGASPRAGISLVNMAKASAYLNGRDYVVPKDIVYVFQDVIAHRIHIKQDNGNIQKKTQILNEILLAITPPKAEKSK